MMQKKRPITVRGAGPCVFLATDMYTIPLFLCCCLKMGALSKCALSVMKR